MWEVTWQQLPIKHFLRVKINFCPVRIKLFLTLFQVEIKVDAIWTLLKGHFWFFVYVLHTIKLDKKLNLPFCPFKAIKNVHGSEIIPTQSSETNSRTVEK